MQVRPVSQFGRAQEAGRIRTGHKVLGKWQEPRMSTPRDRMAEALQCAWNEFVADTGCFPDCFSAMRVGGASAIEADFWRGTFAERAAGWLDALTEPARLREGDATGNASTTSDRVTPTEADC